MKKINAEVAEETQRTQEEIKNFQTLRILCNLCVLCVKNYLFNGDGQINILDWPLLAECLGSPTAYNPNCDFNSDRGRIDLALGSLKPITDSSGCFATITFMVKAEGESTIKFEFDWETNRKTLFIEKGNVVPDITHNEIKVEVVPLVSILLQSYPNPANDLCYIPFKLSEDTEVTVEVYNILGQKVKEINAGYKKAGLYLTKEKALSYNLRNDRGDELSQGLYFINLKAGKYSGKGRLVIQR